MNEWNPGEDEEDFAALFEEFAGGTPPAALKPGQKVEGTFLSLGSEFGFIALGGKSEGIIPREELVDEEGEALFKPGQAVNATVVRGAGRDGEVRLSVRALKSALDDELLAEAFHNRLPVEGRVTAQNKGGFTVRVGGKDAFCPISQIELGFTANPQVHVGQSYPFRVTELSADRFVVSRAHLLREEKETRMAELRGTLKVGDVVEGRVDSLRDFGAFVDLGGVQGLVHISQLCWNRVRHPSEVVEVGDTVRAKVTEVDWSKERIGLSIRELEGDPWSSADWKVGDRVVAKAVRLADYGVFMELKPGVEGLLHISEMSWTKRIRHPREVMAEGDTAEVVVLRLDPLEKRISLGLKQMDGDPWLSGTSDIRGGQVLDGVVESVAAFGVFVNLRDGVTGLVPNKEMDTEPGANHRRLFPAGTAMRVTVLDVDRERRRISLSRKAIRENEEAAERETLPLGDQGDTMGTFGDLLKGFKLDP